MANVMRKPGEWNVYDIIYNSPVFNEDGTYKVHPKVTVIQNGCVIVNDYEIQGTTEYIGFPRVVKHGDGPIILQSHGDPSEPISFRNIWLRPLWQIDLIRFLESVTKNDALFFCKNLRVV